MRIICRGRDRAHQESTTLSDAAVRSDSHVAGEPLGQCITCSRTACTSWLAEVQLITQLSFFWQQDSAPRGHLTSFQVCKCEPKTPTVAEHHMQSRTCATTLSSSASTTAYCTGALVHNMSNNMQSTHIHKLALEHTTAELHATKVPRPL